MVVKIERNTHVVFHYSPSLAMSLIVHNHPRVFVLYTFTKYVPRDFLYKYVKCLVLEGTVILCVVNVEI